MDKLRRLLSATDLSELSRFTAQRAAMLAQEIEAKLELVHVLQQSALDEIRELFEDRSIILQENIRLQTRNNFHC